VSLSFFKIYILYMAVGVKAVKAVKVPGDKYELVFGDYIQVHTVQVYVRLPENL
jgi:hypothetical protein